MTLSELALAGGVLGVVLVLAAGLIGHVRSEAKADQTRRLLAALNQAVGSYHDTHGTYPAGSVDCSTADCLAALRSDQAAWKPLDDLSPLLVAAPAGGGDPIFLDGWGTPLRYLTAKAGRRTAQRIEINAGRPVFESAGPDCDFGDKDLAALTDNLATDDLDID